MAKKSAKPARNDLVVSGFALRAPGHASLVLNTSSSGKPALYLMDNSSNAVTIAIGKSGRCSVTVSKDNSANNSGAGLVVDVFGGGMGVGTHQGHQIRKVSLEEGGLVAHSSIGKPDSEGRLQGISRHGLMLPVPPPKAVDD